MSNRIKTWLVLCIIILLAGCESYENKDAQKPDTRERGTIYISADESFKPVIEAQLTVYKGLHPEADIQVHYKPEAECLKDMLVDSIRMIIATRGYSTAEKQLISDSLKVLPKSLSLARDAIAVIVPKDAQDTMFSHDDLVSILSGTNTNGLYPVFDGKNATSTVRFIVDSVLKGKALTPKAMGAADSKEVIAFVSKNKNAVGLIGVGWEGVRDDTVQLYFSQDVKTAYLQSKMLNEDYLLPVQMNIYTNEYPLVRDLVYILKEKHVGLGTAFANFMTTEKGQLIFRRANLMPAHQKFLIRPARLRE